MAKAHVIGEGLSKCSRWTPRGRRGQHAETQLFWPGDPEWTALRRDTDFYSEDALIWLEADTIIRQQSGGRRSLDDFCRAFFGGMNSAPIEKTYTRDDLIAALTQVAPHDWNQFFQTHIYELAPRAPLLGIENSGWTLIYDANVNETEQDEHSVNLIYSLGMVVQQTEREKEGAIVDVVPDMPAADAGIAPGMKLLAVNDRPWSPKALLEAVGKSEAGVGIELQIDNDGFVRTYEVQYGGGLRFPHLVRDSSRSEMLSDILRAHYQPDVKVHHGEDRDRGMQVHERAC